MFFIAFLIVIGWEISKSILALKSCSGNPQRLTCFILYKGASPQSRLLGD